MFFLLTIGLFSRTMALLAFLFAVSYANRVTPGAYFGLDKINCMLAHVPDARPVRRPLLGRSAVAAAARCADRSAAQLTANLAIRLIQVHMCIIYLFSGIGKLQGEPWVTAKQLALVRHARIPVDRHDLAGQTSRGC